LTSEDGGGGGGTLSCQNCDLREVEKIAQLLLETFYAALVTRYPAKDAKFHKLAKVKNALVQSIFAKGHARSFSFPAFSQSLDQFVQSQQHSSLLHAKKGPLSSQELVRLRTNQTQHDTFMREVTEQLSLEERLGLARAVVRRLDSLFEYHCSVPLCGVDCVFAVQRCPHEGCTARFSRKWWAEHDQSCVHKVVPCALQCGRCLPVHACADHVKNDCIMRPVACPFERMGCKPPGATTLFHV
jgi:hypothetical protein